MKGFIALVMISPVLLFGQSTNSSDTDIRVINGRSVDLAPLHQWYRNPEGADRPLKHWVRLTFLEIKPAYSGSYVSCLVDAENVQREVLFKTLPPIFKDTVTRMRTLETNLNTLQAEIEAEEPEVRRQEALYEGSVVRSTRIELSSAFVTQRYDYERPSRRAVGARLDRVALTEKQELATKVYEELSAIQQNTNSYTVFAMDTQRKFGGLPIWDTGLGGQ